MSKELGRFQREIIEVVEFYVDENNEAKSNIIFKKSLDGKFSFNNPSKYLSGILAQTRHLSVTMKMFCDTFYKNSVPVRKFCVRIKLWR